MRLKMCSELGSLVVAARGGQSEADLKISSHLTSGAAERDRSEGVRSIYLCKRYNTALLVIHYLVGVD